MKFFLSLYLFLLLVSFIEAKAKSYGGKHAKEGQFPYVAFLSGKKCGASILHERWVLTAGHCIKDVAEDNVVKVGTVKRSGTTGTTYKVEKVYIHPDYTLLPKDDNEGTEYVVNDIGLIRVATKITFNHLVKPVVLATDEQNTYENSVATLAGWGSERYDQVMHTYLRYINIRVLSLEKCHKAWPYADKHICTSTQEKKGSCYGDSGSPLVVDGVQIGITSTSDTYCEALKPDVYTKVASFVPWIEKIMAKHGDVLPDS